MKYWDDFLSEVLPYVENCPIPIAKNYIKNAAIELCQRATLWRQELDRINITANIHTYELCTELNTDETISSIDYAYITEDSGETNLTVTTEDAMKISTKVWRTLTATKPESIMMLNTENCRLYPIPEVDITNSLVVGLIMKPSRDAAGVPDWIFEQWAETIAHGAKARLMGMKGRDWYAPSEATDEQADFDLGVKDATIRANKGHSRQNTKVQMRPFA